MKVEEMKQAFVMKYRLIAFDKDGKRRCNEEDMLIGIDEICEAVIAEKSPSNEQIHYVEKAKYDEAVRQRDELKEALEEQKRLYFNLFDEDVSCMYCEVKLKRGSAIILCKECAESTEV